MVKPLGTLKAFFLWVLLYQEAGILFNTHQILNLLANCKSVEVGMLISIWIIATLNLSFSESTTVKLTPFTVIDPFDCYIIQLLSYSNVYFQSPFTYIGECKFLLGQHVPGQYVRQYRRFIARSRFTISFYPVR
jgi:hypothetical protein